MADLEQLKQLRARTDASVGACKKALEDAAGDIERALQLLREEGNKIAHRKAARATGAGIVEAYVHVTRQVGALVEIRSETDFVARNSDFKAFAHDIAMHVAAANPLSTEELLRQPFIKDESKTVGDIVKEAIARFGENIQIARVSRLEI